MKLAGGRLVTPLRGTGFWTRRRLIALATLPLALIVSLAAVVDTAGRPAQAAHGVELLPLARVQFPDTVFGHVMLRLDGTAATRVVYFPPASNMITLKLTIPPGDDISWHSHPGPGFVAVAQGTLTITYADECVARSYSAGQGFLDPGNLVHRADNNGDSDVVAYVTFLGIPPGSPATVPFTGDPGC